MYTEKVREFTKACNEDLPKTPRLLNENDISFIKEMVNDELTELEEAKDLPEQMDALVDAVYYLCDQAVRNGMNLDKIFDIVHKANMSKVVQGKVLRREDGKILKPQGWIDPAPLLAIEVKKQIDNGSFE